MPTADETHMLERISKNENRIDKIEGELMTEVRAIHDKLNALAIAAASRRDCPSPGLCLVLQNRMNEFEDEKRDLSKEILSIQKWQAGIMAALVLLGIIITFFGPSIRHVLGIQH